MKLAQRSVVPEDTLTDRPEVSITVVIPAYRVAGQIAGVLEGIPAYVARVLVVDDASPDDTARVVSAIGDPRVRLIRRERNGGVGAAVVTGYEAALAEGAEVVVKLDGDGQMDPSLIGRLVEPILRGDCDYAKGNRFLHTRQLVQMPFVRRLGNMGLSFLTKASSGYWDVFDPTNGYTAIDARVLKELDWEAVDERWFFETSMLIELGLVRAVVRDVYMPARYAGEPSSLSVSRAALGFPLRLFGAMLRRLWLQYFVREFSPLALFIVSGLVLTLFGVVWGAAHWVESAQTGREASTGTVMLAVLPLILGVQLLLQAIVIDIQSTPRVPVSRYSRR